MSEILVVGSLAYDGISTPAGRVDRALGGSANYFSLAASLFAPVRVVGVVGEDYGKEDEELLRSRRVDLSGLERVKGKTFFWEGKYEGDLNEAITLKTELNVFEHFNPNLPEKFRDSEFVFLANIAPELQMQVLDQVRAPKFVGMDTMNFWIGSKKEALLKILSRVDVVLINETEAEMLTGAANAISAAPKITAMGPKAVVIKRGEYGFAFYSKTEGFCILPAMPIPGVVDPTGAGDTFAGGFFGHLAKLGRVPTAADMREACISGTLLASFTIQDFSVRALAKVTSDDIREREREYLKVIGRA
ncbi:MAG: bifunctional hydroxymethylpyrimidine kinase/phosphomethylpyrimidine kinase [Bdellovibrionaceae bacterium]|nr:bifunctional hydroxymethylpyrimidine kinase/phosphomethylpyrimidine kinase [Pseudobdellovibrionaceae bacterium]MBX3034811.1 bifunctional hydroxymethylpyrimidine kinase/phosphomethylpyrimidine kinase [Pseudobdellovibrionaceae bacterium]